MELTREYLKQKQADCEAGAIQRIKEAAYNQGGADMCAQLLALMDAPASEPENKAEA